MLQVLHHHNRRRRVRLTGQWLRQETRQLPQQPAMRQANLAPALADLNARQYHLDSDDETALIALATGNDPASQLQLP